MDESQQEKPTDNWYEKFRAGRKKDTDRFHNYLSEITFGGLVAWQMAILIAYSTHERLVASESWAVFWSFVALPFLVFGLMLTGFSKTDTYAFSKAGGAISILRLLGTLFSLISTGYFSFSFSTLTGIAFILSSLIAFFIFLHGWPGVTNPPWKFDKDGNVVAAEEPTKPPGNDGPT